MRRHTQCATKALLHVGSWRRRGAIDVKDPHEAIVRRQGCERRDARAVVISVGIRNFSIA